MGSSFLPGALLLLEQVVLSSDSLPSGRACSQSPGLSFTHCAHLPNYMTLTLYLKMAMILSILW